MTPPLPIDNSYRELEELLFSYEMGFRFLSRVFLDEPAGTFIEPIFQDRLYLNWPLVLDDKNFSNGLAKLRSYFERWESGQIDPLRRDFTRLFIGLETTLAPPFASVYLSEEHLLCAEPLLAVRRFFDTANLRVDTSRQLPEDHIGIELHFLSLLCVDMAEDLQEKNLESFEKKRCLAKNFLHSHLLLWVEDFCARVEKHAETPYYSGSALLARGLIEGFSGLVSKSLSGDRSGFL